MYAKNHGCNPFFMDYSHGFINIDWSCRSVAIYRLFYAALFGMDLI